MLPVVTATDAEPFVPPLHGLTFVPLHVTLSAFGCVTVYEQTAVQPLESVTVTVYAPAINAVILEFVFPLLHK
jgi:hypothetical protein